MPPKLIVEVVGDTSGLQKSFQKTGTEAKRLEKNLTHVTRGALSGSRAFEHLGRSLAFASGGFIAVAGVTSFLSDSISAARDAAKAQASLAAQMKASGESFRENKKRVDAAALSYGRFGFENDEVIKSLTVLERGTGKINTALRLQSTAANLARAKNIDLADAANVLAKVFGGQETALRRAVPGLDKNAHGLDLIREASGKLAGQARANTTESERFNAILHNTKEIIGTALLPIVDKYLTSLGDWLDKMNRSGKLQRDVNSAVKTATGIFQGVKAAVDPLVGAFKALGDAVGGTKNEVKLLSAAFVAFRISKLVGGLGLIGSTAAVSTSQVRGLRGALLRLGALGAITVGITLLTNRKGVDKAVSGFLDSHGLPGGTNAVTTQQILQDPAKLARALGGTKANSLIGQALGQLFAPFVKDLNAIQRAARTATRRSANIPGGIGGSGLRLPGSVGGSGSLGGGLPSSVSGSGSGIARLFGLPGRVGGSGQRTSALVPHHIGGEFQQLAAGFQAPIGIQLGQARAEALGDTKGLASLAQRLKKVALRALKSGKLSIQAQIDAWNVIGQINQAATQNGFGPTGRVQSAAALTKGIAFASTAARKAQEQRLAQFLGHGGKLGTTVVHTHVHLDGKQVAQSVTTHQQKQQRHRATQTSGINAGRGHL